MRRSSLRAAWARVHETFRRSTIASELDEEFRFHIEMETAENVRRGMPEAEARRAALLRFGGTQRFREETADARGLVALDTVARDARLALRRIRRTPAFAAGVIATLGVGIGVAVGIGTIVWGVLLRDLPYDDPDRLVRVGFHTDGITAPGDLHSEATFLHFAESARSFTELGAYNIADGFALTDGDAPERVTAAMVTPSTLTLLGARPLLGQLFEPGDTSWTNGRAPILISQGLWERRYGADPAIIGRRVDINRGARVVIGVLARAFDFPSPAVDVYYPTPVRVDHPQITSRHFGVIGRLRDGATTLDAAAELNTLVPALASRFPAITPELLERSQARVTVASLKAATVASVRPHLVLLGVLVAVVLLIATTNVVNLFLLRTERASQEIAIALSLGASRMAMAQRFVIEGIVLGLASAIVALPGAALALSTKFGFTEREIPRLHEVSVTPGTIVLVAGCAAAIGALVGLTALTRTRIAGLFDRLRAGRSTSSRTWSRAQNSLVAFQVAIALALLVAAGLLGRSFWNLRSANIGFEPANAMTVELSLPWNGYGSYAENAAFHATVIDRLTALPGVASAGAALHLPLTTRGTLGFDMEIQRGDADGQPPVVATGNMASADYFRVMGIPLRAGRSFRDGDLRGVPAVVVSERLAINLFGTADVVGRTIGRLGRGGARPSAFRIVGVVGDVHGARIEDGYSALVYFPLLRGNDGLPADSSPVPYKPRDVQYAMRGTQLPSATTVQGIVTELDRRVPSTNVRRLDSLVDDATSRVRLTMLLIAVAGAAALLLGVIGVYSVVSYAAAGRAREFAIRLALGAAPNRIGGAVFGDGLRLVAIGTLGGLAAAIAAARFLRALLYEVEPTSIAEFAVATAVLVAVSLVATVIPARRAAQTDPAGVLRGE
jgi:predicted permease